VSLILQLPKNKDRLIFLIIAAFLVEDRMVNPFLLYIQQSNHLVLVEIRYSLFIARANG
jgi:hypothetical protein